MAAGDVAASGAAAVRAHLAPGERVVHATEAVVRARLPRRTTFLGLRPGRSSAVVLTTTRLLALRPGDPSREDWLDLQLARSGVAASTPEEVAGHPVVHLTTGLGPRVLLFGRGGEADARRLVDSLRSGA